MTEEELQECREWLKNEMGSNRVAQQRLGITTGSEYACVQVERLLEEIDRQKQLALTCCSCKKPLASLEELKAHIVACPDHPIAQYVAAEREACALIAWGDEDRDDFPWCGDVREIAAQIRARGKP